MNPSTIGLNQIFSGKRLLALVVLGTTEFVRGALLFFILPIYVRGVLGLPAEVVGYALAAHYTMDTALRSPAGWMTDRFGQRKVMTVALLVGWFGLLTIVRAHHEWTVILGSAILGLGISAVWPAVISRVTFGLTRDSYATAMGGVITSWLVGAGAGAVTTSWLLGDHVRSGFVSLLTLWLLAAALSLLVMQGYRFEAHHRRRAGFRSLLSEVKKVRLLFPGMFVQTFAMGVLMPVFVLYARYQLGITGKEYSYLLVAGGAATVLLQIPMGRLVDRYGYKRFLVLGFALCAGMLPILVHLRHLWAVFLGVGSLGAGYALILPSWNAVLARSISEQRRAVMWGIFMTVEGLGMSVGPLVGGQLFARISPTAPFWGASMILFVMMLFYSFAPLQRLFVEADKSSPSFEMEGVSHG